MATKSETNFIGPKNHVSGTQAIIIATQNRTSHVAVTYERSVSTAGSDAIPRLVQLLCGSTIARSVRDEELATWEGAPKGSERKQLGEGKRAFAYESLVCLPPCTSTVLC